MEARVQQLEDFAAETRARLDQMATKADLREHQLETKAALRELESNMVKWIVGTAGTMMVAFVTMMTFVLNNAVPKAPAPVVAASAPVREAPIIINIPAPASPNGR